MKVALLMGSKNDFPKIRNAYDVLKELGIDCRVRVMSAHRTPDAVMDFVGSADENGYKVIMAAAGMAAHLAGVVAAHTLLPVIGIPVEGGPFKGMDALMATVMMPGGIPVATVGVGSGGAKNAGILAAQICAIGNPELTKKLKDMRAANAKKVMADDHALQADL